MPTGRRLLCRLGLVSAALLLSTAVGACSGELEPTPAPSATVAQAPSGAAPEAASKATPEVIVVLASTDLGVGPNRLTFGVLDRTSKPLRVPQATTTFVFLDVEPVVAVTQGTATFVKWPTGPAGVFVVEVSFDRAGRWGLIVEAIDGEGEPTLGQAGFVVKEESSSPGIGRPAPASINKTTSDVTDISHLTSSLAPNLELYQVTIADAIESGKPTVVTFATPAFCQTATCGPQVGVVAALEDRFEGQAQFIHVEVYDNPHEIEGDLSNARLSPLMDEWGLATEPFTFVIDGEGLVRSKYEGFVRREELESALLATLAE